MANKESRFLTEQEAYEKSIGYAQSLGLQGQPTSYSMLQMTLGEYGESTDLTPEAAEQADTAVWVFACRGTIERSLPDGSPASYMAFAIDAITGVPASLSDHYPSDHRRKERPFPIP